MKYYFLLLAFFFFGVGFGLPETEALIIDANIAAVFLGEFLSFDI
jgi:hypothetical protein